MGKILLIIPAYNEEDNILKTYNSIIKYNKNNNTKYDVIIINDGSTDNTEKILKKNSVPHIELINNLGIGGAVQTGYKYAYLNDYDIAIQFDGDGQHNVDYIEKIIKPVIDNEAEFIIGSRYIDKQKEGFQSSKGRRIGIKIISFVIKIRTKKRIYDTTSGFRAANKEIIKLFALDYPLEYPEPITTTELLKSGYRIKEIPVVMNERKAGVSSIKTWKSFYYMINVCLSIIFLMNRRTK